MANNQNSPLPYALKPDAFSSHSKITQLIQQCQQESGILPYTVLDIGCADGFLRHFLPSPKFYLMGTDINQHAVTQAQSLYDHAVCCDISRSNLPDLPKIPNAIVFADILEHVVNPDMVLKNVMNTYASKGTRVIISLPNVANIYVRLSLLVGKFRYSDKGILDKTHLRFFTFASAQNLVESAGIQITTVTATPIPLPILSDLFARNRIFHFLHRINNALTIHLKQLLGYQIIIEGVYHEK